MRWCRIRRSTRRVSLGPSAQSISHPRGCSGQNENHVVPQDDLVFAKAHSRIRNVLSALQMELVAVPGADDMRIVIIEGLPTEAPLLVDPIPNSRDPDSLACRATLMRAEVAICKEGTLMPD